jgi:isoquinoline 1-oxidoreductase subunit alpha
MKFQLLINGQQHEVEADPGQPLLWVLRDSLGMVGTRLGCGVGQCGCCTVTIDGLAQRACLTAVSTIGPRAIETIEASGDEVARALQDAWVRHNVPQCGYCQSGQLMSARALLRQNPKPALADINKGMAGNICRCGTYPRIRAAIMEAAGQLADTPAPSLNS